MGAHGHLDDLVQAGGFVDAHDDFHGGPAVGRLAPVIGLALDPVRQFHGLPHARVLTGRGALFPAAGLRVDEQDALFVHVQHAVRTVEVAALAPFRMEFLQELTHGSVVEAHDARAAVLDPDVALVPVRLALDVPEHPFGRGIAHDVAHEIEHVGAVVEQALAAAAVYVPDVAYGAFGDQVPGVGPHRVEAPLVGDGQLDVVPSGRDHHLVAFAHVDRHGFLAQNGLGPARAGGDGQGGVELVPGTDADDVQPLLVQHLPGVGIAFSNIVPVAEILPGLGHRVRKRYNLEPLFSQVSIHVQVRDAAAPDYADTIDRGHLRLLPGRILRVSGLRRCDEARRPATSGFR